MSIFTSIRDWLEDFKEYFEPGPDTRFPSPITAVVRFLLRFIFVLIPILYVGLVIAMVATGVNTIGPALLTGILSTAVALILISLLLLILMVFETFAKAIATLILCGETPSATFESENPVDDFVYSILETRKK